MPSSIRKSSPFDFKFLRQLCKDDPNSRRRRISEFSNYSFWFRKTEKLFLIKIRVTQIESCARRNLSEAIIDFFVQIFLRDDLE